MKLLRMLLAGLLLHAQLLAAPAATPTLAQWGVDRTTTPWTVCLYDQVACKPIGQMQPAGGSGITLTPVDILLTPSNAASAMSLSQLIGQTFNVTFFGADPTGTVDSCASPLTGIPAAVTALNSYAGAAKLFLPGTFKCNGVAIPTISNKAVDISGISRGASTIIFGSAVAGQAGFSINETGSPYNQPTVHDLTLKTAVNQANGNAAIKVVDAFGSISKGPEFYNLDIRGLNDAFYWARGIDCHACTAGSAHDIVVAGLNNIGAGVIITPYNAPAWAAGTAFYEKTIVINAGKAYLAMNDGISGATAPTCTTGSCSDGVVTWRYEQAFVPNTEAGIAAMDGSTDFKVYDYHSYLLQAGLYVGADAGGSASEGVGCDQCIGVGVNWGVLNNRAEVFVASQFVSNSHFNSMLGGVFAPGGQQRHYGPSNLFYKWTASINDWVGVDMRDGTNLSGASYGSVNNIISNNTCYGFHGTPTVGGLSECIRIGHGADWNTISGNNTTLTDYFMDEGVAPGQHNIITANISQILTFGWYLNTSPYSAKSNNIPPNSGAEAAVGSFGQNSTSVFVAGGNQSAYGTNATVATSISQFLATRLPGYVFTMFCTDTLTTLVNFASGAGANSIALGTGANYTCPRVGATITFQYIDFFRETSRTN